MTPTPRRTSIGPIILAVVGLVLVAGAMSVGLPSRGSPAAPTLAAEGEVPRVRVADSRAALDAGAAVFVDVRDPEAYAASHVPGARSIPLPEIRDRASELDPEAWIITYCT
jgi:3-mercaptopyruvate sulfurtransferase SseA